MKKLFVGNLQYQATEQDLMALADEHAIPATRATVITDRDTGQSRGFGFLEIEGDDCEEAVQRLHGQDLMGRTLTVNEARPKEDRPSGGGRREHGRYRDGGRERD